MDWLLLQRPIVLPVMISMIQRLVPLIKQFASKYDGAGEGTINSLANNIIKGSTGVWGQVPMPPHPSLIKEDTKVIVRYILLLKD
jgi:Cytochrome c551/c552